jgi:spore maturation protein CgeB
MEPAQPARAGRLRSNFYDPIAIDLDQVLADADVVIAHEWNDPAFLSRLGDHRAKMCGYKLLFHDAPHRSLKQALETRARVLSHYDAVLTSSDSLRQLHVDESWADNVWTWRDAVDTRVFRPSPGETGRSLDVLWIGSWGNGERASELDEFLIEPIRALGLRARLYGARYPADVLRTLRSSGIDYGGWIPDFCIPAALASARFAVNVPRRMQAEGLPYTPAIRVLEALACGIPVVTAPWDECEELFSPDIDLLVAHDGPQMERHLIHLHADPDFARSVANSGYQKVLSHHTCAHRAQELLAICEHLGAGDVKPEQDLDDQVGMLPHARSAPAESSHAPAAWN